MLTPLGIRQIPDNLASEEPSRSTMTPQQKPWQVANPVTDNGDGGQMSLDTQVQAHDGLMDSTEEMQAT